VTEDAVDIAVRMAAALAAGGLISTFGRNNIKALAGILAGLPNILEFHVSPTAE
jgi:hypothetical protein